MQTFSVSSSQHLQAVNILSLFELLEFVKLQLVIIQDVIII